MTEYDYSPEAYERYMATKARISNWVDNVSQSMQTPSSHASSDQYRSRPLYSQSQPHSRSHSHSHSQHSRSNSASRTPSREHHYYHREPTRQRSHSYSSSRPHATRSFTQPVHSRTYSYAFNQLPPPAPIPLPPPPFPFTPLAPRRSRTLPPPPHNIVYHHYDVPRGGGSYVIIPPVYGGAPPQIRMQSSVTPTKRAQPLLKRLLTSFGPWSSSSSAPSPKSKHTLQRRHRRRSSF